jgi:thiosulfate reductase cytochrome b subunit
MFCKKKTRSWYFYAFWALLFCVVLYVVARLFSGLVTKSNNPKIKKKNQGKEELFI